MLKKFHIENFKSLVDVKASLGPFTAFVGKNGAGKSSFLQALDLLSWSVRYDTLDVALADNGVEFSDLVYLHSPARRIELTGCCPATRCSLENCAL